MAFEELVRKVSKLFIKYSGLLVFLPCIVRSY